ncbi:hypothetical protein ANO11243_086200 [Dothideomycetidae sp. 11243]|nr:hypothetical protein ANO11243_086200 [fungal sp. No.11243]
MPDLCFPHARNRASSYAFAHGSSSSSVDPAVNSSSIPPPPHPPPSPPSTPLLHLQLPLSSAYTPASAYSSSVIPGTAAAADTPRGQQSASCSPSISHRLSSPASPTVATPPSPAVAQLAPALPLLQQARKRPLSRGAGQDTTLLLKKSRPPPLTSSKSSSAVPTLSTAPASALSSPTTLSPAPRSPADRGIGSSSSINSSPRSWLGRSITAAPVLTAADLLRQSIMLG